MFKVIVTTSTDPNKTADQRRQLDSICIHANPLTPADDLAERPGDWSHEAGNTRLFAYGTYPTLESAQQAVSTRFYDFAPSTETNHPINRLEEEGPIVAAYQRQQATYNTPNETHFWLELWHTVPSDLTQAEKEGLAARFEAMAVEKHRLLDHETVMQFIEEETHRGMAEDVIEVLTGKLTELETRTQAFSDKFPATRCTDLLEIILRDIVGLHEALDAIDALSILPDEPLNQDWALGFTKRVREGYQKGIEATKEDLPY